MKTSVEAQPGCPSVNGAYEALPGGEKLLRHQQRSWCRPLSFLSIYKSKECKSKVNANSQDVPRDAAHLH